MTRVWRVAGVAGISSVLFLVAACGSESSTSAGAGTGSGSAPAPAAASSESGSAPAAASSAPASPGGLSPRAASGGCATSSLNVALGTSQGAAGSIYVAITFTNSGSSNCTLTGYPGVSVTAGSPAAQVGAAAARDGNIPTTTVTLAPGAVASATLQITEAGNYPPATCQPTPISAILVYPPNQTQSVSLPYTGTGCASGSVTLLHVSAVQAGAGGQ